MNIDIISLYSIQAIGWVLTITSIIIIAYSIYALLTKIPELNQKNEAKIGILAHKAMIRLIIGSFAILALVIVLQIFLILILAYPYPFFI